METMELKVNELPGKTWNWLHMNESRIDGVSVFGEHAVSVTAPKAVRVERGAVSGFEKIRTGLGADMNRLLQAAADEGEEAAGEGAAVEESTETAGKRTAVGKSAESAGKRADFGLRLTAGDNQRIREAVRLDFAYRKGERAANRVDILAEPGSEITVIMDCRSAETGKAQAADSAAGAQKAAGAGTAASQVPSGAAFPERTAGIAQVQPEAALSGSMAGIAALQTRIFAKAGARVRLVQILRLDDEAAGFNDVGIYGAENASAEVIHLLLSGKALYQGLYMTLAGRGSSLTADIGYRGTGKRRLDMNYVARHVGAGTVSEINASGVLRDQSFKLFRGTIDFIKGAAGAKGDEKENVLLLDDDVVNQTIPLILCAEEDVEGNHGATIGQLDEELLFYLESRGMAREAVQEMMAKARLLAVARKIPDAAAREEIERYLAGETEQAAVPAETGEKETGEEGTGETAAEAGRPGGFETEQAAVSDQRGGKA